MEGRTAYEDIKADIVTSDKSGNPIPAPYGKVAFLSHMLCEEEDFEVLPPVPLNMLEQLEVKRRKYEDETMEVATQLLTGAQHLIHASVPTIMYDIYLPCTLDHYMQYHYSLFFCAPCHLLRVTNPLAQNLATNKYGMFIECPRCKKPMPFSGTVRPVKKTAAVVYSSPTVRKISYRWTTFVLFRDTTAEDLRYHRFEELAETHFLTEA